METEHTKETFEYGTVVLNCTILYPIDDSSHHEIEPYTGKEMKRPRTARRKPTESLLLFSVHPMDMAVPEAPSPLDYSKTIQEDLVKQALRDDEYAIPFMRWVRESPIGKEQRNKMETLTSFAARNIAHEARRFARAYAGVVHGVSANYVQSVQKKIAGSELEACLLASGALEARQSTWGQSSFAVLDRLVGERDKSFARTYIALLGARANNQTKEVLKYAELLLYPPKR